MATKITGLYQRGGMFWLRVLAPKDLQTVFYDGKRIAFDGSLGTGDPQAARVAAVTKRAEMEAQFLSQRRQLAPPKLAHVSPELRQCIVDTLKAQEVAVDASQRLDKTRSTSVHSGVSVAYALADGSLPERPTAPPVSPLRPLSPEVVTARAAFNQKRLVAVRAALASGDLQAMIPIVQPIAQRLGLAIDYETADGVQLLSEALAAYSEAREVAVQRDQGLAVPTPPMPTVPAVIPMATAAAVPVPVPASGPTQPGAVPEFDLAGKPLRRRIPGAVYLRDIKADWLAIKARSRPAIYAVDHALRHMGEAGVDVPLADLNRQHGATLRAHLVSTGIKGKSVKNAIAALQSLLNVAVDSGKLSANPWAGLKVDKSDSIQRLPWRTEDLCKLVAVNNARGADPRRWLLPLGLYTSARIGELAQLELSDVQQIDGIWCVEIHDRKSDGHHNRTVKTKAGLRLIPISQHLIDLGFLEYVETAKLAGQRFVFPKFIQNGSRLPSTLATADFLKLRVQAGLPAMYASNWKSITQGDSLVRIKQVQEIAELEFTERHYAALGKVTVAFQALEGTISHGLLALLHPEKLVPDSAFAFAVINEHSFANKLKLLLVFPNLLTGRELLSTGLTETLKETVKLLIRGGQLAGEAERQRNRVMHSMWVHGTSVAGPAGTVLRIKSRLKQKGVQTSSEFVTAEDIEAIANTAVEAQRLLFDATRDLHFVMHSAHANPASSE